MNTTGIKRFYENDTEAIKAAKQRARTQYHTHYIYQSEQGFYIRGWLDTNPLPVLKVRFDGDVTDLRKERAEE